VPQDEAQRTADETLEQLRARGAEAANRRASRRFFSGVAVALGLRTLAVIAAVVVLLVH
jgi:hypothetical protein